MCLSFDTFTKRKPTAQGESCLKDAVDSSIIFIFEPFPIRFFSESTIILS